MSLKNYRQIQKHMLYLNYNKPFNGKLKGAK